MAPARLDDEPNRRLRGLRCLVGNTPLLAIDFTFHGRPRRVYAKAENLNYAGTIWSKNRRARAQIMLGSSGIGTIQGRP